jgi:putative ABC transport system substrate-binding protein
VIADPMTLRNRDAIVRLAAEHRLPAAYEFAEFARSGGLVAYSASIPALFERAAVYVDKILRGTRPGDLPVEQPTRYGARRPTAQKPLAPWDLTRAAGLCCSGPTRVIR